ncbi:LysR family transcriptional regulator [Erwinia persicina]|uniref:LysR family transcriptional regulator n=1 Tax=Erwinia persicina TaxID=55211 RepID=UPI00177BA805|nr:LysR family transcriptional regulator [Erwinia persicina]MBD8161654.1 LysR family transcriptional regulator [Erwinia persicina]
MHSSEIRYFLAVANSGSLSAASQQLFVAVSAISRQIQRLEARVGAPLFERHARGMVLNDAGQIFENHVRKSMMDMEHAIAEIKGLKAIRRTALRVACTDGMAFSLLPVLFTQFRLLHPGVSFHLTVASALEVAEIMRRGECDVAFQFSLYPERGVEVVAAWPAPVLLVMQQDHPLAEQQVQLSDLNAYPLALPDAGTTVRQLFDLSCRMTGTFVEPALTCNNFSTLYTFLLQTPEAITICSQFTVMYQAVEHGLVLKSVGADQLSQRSLQVQTAIGRKPGPALSLFLEFVRQELKQKDDSIRAVFAF